jgi:hypothetical protein
MIIARWGSIGRTGPSGGNPGAAAGAAAGSGAGVTAAVGFDPDFGAAAAAGFCAAGGAMAGAAAAGLGAAGEGAEAAGAGGGAAAAGAAAAGAGVIALTAVWQAPDSLARLRLRQSKASLPPGVTPEQFAMKSERHEARIAPVCSGVGCCA